MTAQDIVTRIQQQLASQKINWRTETVDTFKAGDPRNADRGIATTGMATFSVLKRAAKANRNFVITHEPTFYNHQDQTAALAQDPTYEAKQRFIKDNRLVVWRFHDHAHALGRIRWSPARPVPSAGRRMRRQRAPHLQRSADHARRPGGRHCTATEGRAIRVAGDPAMKVARVALGPGYGVPADDIGRCCGRWRGIRVGELRIPGGRRRGGSRRA